MELKDGYWRTKEEPPFKSPYIRKHYTSYIFRDQPEIVNLLASQWDLVRESVDLPMYQKWCRRLEKSADIKSASSIQFDYEFKIPPYDHQKKAIAFMLNLPAAALFMDPGTGKTFCALVATEMRKRAGLVKKTLVLCPASVVKSGWHEDLLKFTDLKGHILRKKRMYYRPPGTRKGTYTWKEGRPLWLKQNQYKTLESKLYESDDDVYICGLEYFSQHHELFLGAGFDQIILDESTMIKSPGVRFNAVKKLGNTVKYRYILTGTPIPNTVEDIWSQMKFLDNSLEDTFGMFQGRYMNVNPKMPGMRWEKPGARDHVMSRIENRCLRIKKEDCLDLPERVTIVRKVEPPPKIRKVYNKFMDDMYARLESGHEVYTFNRLVQGMRLQQILNGYVTDDQDVHLIEKPNHKLGMVHDIVSTTPDKCIIWAIYRNDFKLLAEKLKAYNPAIANGGTDVDKATDKFRGDDSCRVILAHPQSCKFGHTWNFAKTMIHYSYSYSLESFLQSRERNYRIGQDSKVTEFFITSGGVEDDIIDALLKKKKNSDYAMELLEDTLLTMEL